MTCYRHPDRETGVSCSECGRGICTDCMVFAPVGIRCPDHSGQPQGMARVTSSVRRAGLQTGGMLVTKTLIAINVLVYLAELAAGGTMNGTGNWLYEHGVLVASALDSSGEIVGVAHGDWWRLITAAFLHYGPLHLAMNMVSLWWIGGPLEHVIGRARFVLLYLVSGLAGSAGALLVTPNAATVGASGAIFGIFGAVFVLERQGAAIFGGSVVGLIVLNLAFTFAVPGISRGGHIGGLLGGALAMLALSRFGRGHAIYGRPGLIGVLGVLAVGVASVALAYWRVRGVA